MTILGLKLSRYAEWIRHLFKRQKTLKEIATAYVNDHPEAQDSITRAMFAYHIDHFSSHPKAHYFTSADRESRCAWGGRSRVQVRWDGDPPECSKRPTWTDKTISSVIREEEDRFEKMLKEMPAIVYTILKSKPMSGETLAYLKQTHGYDPQTVMQYLDRPYTPDLMKDFENAYSKHRRTGEDGHHPTIIVAK